MERLLPLVRERETKRIATFAIALMAFAEVNVMFLRQRIINKRQDDINRENRAYHVKYSVIQEEMLRNARGLQGRVEQLEPGSNPASIVGLR